MLAINFRALFFDGFLKTNEKQRKDQPKKLRNEWIPEEWMALSKSVKADMLPRVAENLKASHFET